MTVANAEDLKMVVTTFEKAWRATCGGKRVYLVVDYDGFSMEPGMLPAYAEMVKGVLSKHVITIVRYGERLAPADERAPHRHAHPRPVTGVYGDEERGHRGGRAALQRAGR